MVKHLTTVQTCRSSHRRCSIKKVVPKNFVIFTGKHLCQIFRVCNFIKKRLQRRCFPVNIAKFSRTPVLKSICERLLLNMSGLCKGVRAIVSIKIPQTLLAPCTPFSAHTLNLCAVHAVESTEEVKNYLRKVQKLYIFFFF